MTAPTLAPPPSTTARNLAATLAALDAAHRARQAANAQRVAELVLSYFLTRVNADDLAGTSGPWLDFSIGAIRRGYEQSYLISSAYTQAVQRAEIPGATPIEIPRPTPPPESKLRRSLSYTGPGTVAVELKKVPGTIEAPPGADRDTVESEQRAQVTRGERVKIVMQKAASAAAGTTYKNVMNGGRDTIDNLVVTKKVAGYVRITKDKPCGFCLMLASRGPVYAEDSFEQSNARFTGPGDHKVHDTCGCSLRPAFTRNPEHWTDQARTADQLWQDMLKKIAKDPTYSKGDPVNAFRRMAREAGLADLTRY